jgi:hypothetical protein
MAMNVKAYARELQTAAQAISRFREQDAQLRENRELRPEIIGQRRTQLADETRQTVTGVFDKLIDQAATAAKQTPPAGPTLDAAGWQERSYWRTRYQREIASLDANRLRELVDTVAEQGSVPQRLELYDLAEQRYRELGDSRGLTRLYGVIEAGRSPEERAQRESVETATELHGLLRQLRQLALMQVESTGREVGGGIEPERLAEHLQAFAEQREQSTQAAQSTQQVAD